jgi:hypothetical protein
LNVPEAVTDTITTQWPEAQVPAPVPVHADEVTEPPLSHPQETEELTLNPLCPLFWKSFCAAKEMFTVSTDCGRLSVP